MLEMVLVNCGFVFGDRKPGLTSRLTLSYNLSFTQNRLNYATLASPPRLSEHGHFWVWGAIDWLRQDLNHPRWLQYSENDLEILMPLLPPKCWKYRCVPLCQVWTQGSIHAKHILYQLGPEAHRALNWQQRLTKPGVSALLSHTYNNYFKNCQWLEGVPVLLHYVLGFPTTFSKIGLFLGSGGTCL